MEKFVTWLNRYIIPKTEKIVQNPWIAAISSSFTIILPFILAGSVISLYSVLTGYLPVSVPNFNIISTYSMSLISLLIVFAIPSILMEKKGHNRYMMVSGMLGLAAFLMILNGNIEDGFLKISFGEFGPGGTMVALVVGLVTAAVFNAWLKLRVLENSDIPDFIVEWINGLVPTIIVLGICYIALACNFNLSASLTMLLSPLFRFGQSYAGMLVVTMIPNFLYSFGIGTRTTSAFRNPIYYAGIAVNVELVAAGLAATDIVTFETIHTCALICLGGTGCTLTLVLLMLFSKSKKMKTMGRIMLVPSLFNINEPVIYGTPIAYNPLLMIPMWINAFTTSTIVYFSMRLGLLNIPSYVFQAWSLPAPIGAILATSDFRAVLIWIVVMAVTLFTWLPFFKAYEKRIIIEEGEFTS